MTRYVTVKRFSAESGYTEAAIRAKIRDGIWRLGEIWKRAPDQRTLIDIEGYEKWVETGEGSEPSLIPVSKSRSCTRGSGAASASSSSPPPLT